MLSDLMKNNMVALNNERLAKIWHPGNENLQTRNCKLQSRIKRPSAGSDAGLAQSVERLTAEREVAGSIPGVEAILAGSWNNWEMKVLPLPCKWLDFRVAQMTT